MAIKNKILYGYFLSFGIAIVGTSIGLIVGNYYQNQALQSSQIASRERRLIGKIQVDVLYNRPAKQLSPYLQQPEKFQQETKELSDRLNGIYQVLITHNKSAKPATLEGLQPLLDEYQIIVEKFAEKARRFATQVQPLTQSATGAITAEKRLVELVKSPEFVSFIEFPDRLSKFAQLAEEREEQKGKELEKAEALRTQIILVGLSLSIMVAIPVALYISDSIANPIQTLTDIAQTVTKESNFDVQASIQSQDEIGVLANSLNQLIEKVRIYFNKILTCYYLKNSIFLLPATTVSQIIKLFLLLII